ncbi:MAG TPA: heavy metal sensor histidine kinase [Humisphaera sp.]|jgi:two-component system heavy metal sensor histidine kinase CusS|nr:heavy metal sensor histidine kinase [Humisphaera sp.]
MSWKTAPDARKTSARALSRQWSLAARLAAGFTLAGFALLLITCLLLYLALASSLDVEDREYLGEKLSTLDGLLQGRPGDLDALRAEIERESKQHFYPPAVIRAIDASGAVLVETPGMSEQLPRSLFPAPLPFSGGRWGYDEIIGSQGRSFGIVTVTLSSRQPNGPITVQIGLDESQEQVLLARYRRWLWLAMGGGWFICAFVGYAIARRGLAPIKRMAATVHTIGSENLNERVDPAGFPTELSSLAQTFNGMLQRLEDSFNRLSQFSADIAHELRTPIGNMRGLVEVALNRSDLPPEDRKLLGPCMEECQRLSRLIDNLLFLARAQSPQTRINRQSVNLADELQTVREFYEAAATEAHVNISVAAPTDLSANLDRLLIQRALGNLVENALAYTPAGGAIELIAAVRDGSLCIEVADSGCGIPAENLPRLFDRFHRVDPSRSKHTGGVGLGLAIVKGISALHGGTVEVLSRVGAGSCFTMRLPLEGADPQV